jgi:hypothetical protein
MDMGYGASEGVHVKMAITYAETVVKKHHQSKSRHGDMKCIYY